MQMLIYTAAAAVLFSAVALALAGCAAMRAVVTMPGEAPPLQTEPDLWSESVESYVDSDTRVEMLADGEDARLLRWMREAQGVGQ